MAKDSLVLLPGTLCDDRMWQAQADELSDCYDIMIGDLTKSDTIKGLAEDVLQKAPKKFSLAGLSLGGMVAMEVIHQAPERVERLALLNSNPYAPKPEQQKGWNKFKEMVNKGRFREITKDYLLPNLVHPSKLKDKELMNTITDMADTIGPEAYLRQLNAVATRDDLRPILKNITCPTLLLVGREDTVCPVEFHKKMKKLILDAKLVVINECGHLSSMDQPKQVTVALRNWLKS